MTDHTGGPMQYYQGDVPIIATDSVPADAQPLTPRQGRWILREGEATGHHHSIAVRDGVEVYSLGAERYLRVTAGGGVSIDHQEHDSITLPPGTYRIGEQMEYSEGLVQRVKD